MATPDKTALQGDVAISPSQYADLFSKDAMGPQLPLSQRELEVSELARPKIEAEDHPNGSGNDLAEHDFVLVDIHPKPAGSDRDSGVGNSRPNSGELASPEISPAPLTLENQHPETVIVRPKPSSVARPKSVRLHEAAHLTHEIFEQFLNLEGATNGSEEFAKEVLEALGRTAQALGDVKMGSEIIFPGLEGILSLPTFFMSSAKAVSALREGRMIDFSDHSSGTLKASLAISGAGIELASAAQEIAKEGWIEAAKAAAAPSGHVVSTLDLAASGVSIAGWAVYGGMQVFALSQMSKPMNNLQKILRSSLPEELKMHEAFKEMEAEFVVTNAEIASIRAKTDDEDEALKEVEILFKKKLNKLKRCVGDKKAKQLSSQLMMISRTLDHARAHEDEAHLIPINEMISEVVKSMKNEMAKQKVLRYEKLMLSVAGMTAAGIGIACPIAGAVLAVTVSAAAIYIWYQGRKNNAEKYAEMKIFGHKLFDFEAPEAAQDEGIQEAPPIAELDEEDDIDDYLPPGEMLINPTAVRGFDINEVDISLPEDEVLINPTAVRGFDINEVDISLPEDGVLINEAMVKGPDAYSEDLAVNGFTDLMKQVGEAPPTDWMA